MVRRLVLFLFVLGAVVAVGPPADAGCRFDGERLAGPDRIDTAIAISKRGHATDRSAKGAVLARSDAFADALAGAPFAARHDGPLLLTPSSSLDQRVAAELRRAVAPGSTVYLLGGTGALSAEVEAAVRADGFTPRRIAGANRYETSVAAAKAFFGDPGDPSQWGLATGENFPDALAGGALVTRPGGGPILLTTRDAMPPAVDEDRIYHAGIMSCGP